MQRMVSLAGGLLVGEVTAGLDRLDRIGGADDAADLGVESEKGVNSSTTV
ncbi:hypothetical protein [Streptomyces sp. NPDC049744]